MRRREDPWRTRGCGELGGCCFRPLDSRPGGEQFLIGEIDQIHKMDRVSEVTFKLLLDARLFLLAPSNETICGCRHDARTLRCQHAVDLLLRLGHSLFLPWCQSPQCRS
jgi:hypothetical protein